MNLNQYIETVSKRFLSGISREHSYRADLEALIRGLVTDVEITNEPANVTERETRPGTVMRCHQPMGMIYTKQNLFRMHWCPSI